MDCVVNLFPFDASEFALVRLDYYLFDGFSCVAQRYICQVHGHFGRLVYWCDASLCSYLCPFLVMLIPEMSLMTLASDQISLNCSRV